MQKNTQSYIVGDEKELENINIDLHSGDRIFFYGDLGAGKSTLIRHILRKYLSDPALVVRSPTYTYYQKYSNIYHCDLYRIEDYPTWVSIGGEEIIQDSESIFLIEWPEILGDTVKPNKKISIEVMENGDRHIFVETLI